MYPSEVKFRHFYDRESMLWESCQAKGGVTVAYVGGVYSMALCSHKDFFSRPRGRLVALERMRRAAEIAARGKPLILIPPMTGCSAIQSSKWIEVAVSWCIKHNPHGRIIIEVDDGR